MQRGTLNSGHTGVSSQSLEQDWTLDATGNWKEFVEVGNLDQQRDHNTANEITNIAATLGPTWTTPAYDRAGNSTSFPQPLALTSSYTAKYDAWNRLVELKDGSTSVATLRYDGLGRRTTFAEPSSGVRHYYYSDQWQVLEENLNDAKTPDRRYLWGLRYIDDLLRREAAIPSSSSSSLASPSSSSATFTGTLYSLQDANWNVVALVNPAGSLEQRIAYSAYGVPLFLDDAFDPSSNRFDWETLFTGQRYDALTGLYLYRMRYYQPQLGRFVTRDPLEHIQLTNSDLYIYTGDSPIFGTGPDHLP